jgi:hypothetical protein
MMTLNVLPLVQIISIKYGHFPVQCHTKDTECSDAKSVCGTGETEHLGGLWLLSPIVLGDPWPGHLDIGNNHKSHRHILFSGLYYIWNPWVTRHWVQPPGRTGESEGPCICGCCRFAKEHVPHHCTLHTLYMYPISEVYLHGGADRRIRCHNHYGYPVGWSCSRSIMWKVKGSHEIWKEVGWTAPGIWGVLQ